MNNINDKAVDVVLFIAKRLKAKAHITHYTNTAHNTTDRHVSQSKNLRDTDLFSYEGSKPNPIYTAHTVLTWR